MSWFEVYAVSELCRTGAHSGLGTTTGKISRHKSRRVFSGTQLDGKTIALYLLAMRLVADVKTALKSHRERVLDTSTVVLEAELYSVFAWRQAKQDSANSLGSSALPLLRHLNCARRNGVQWKRRSKKSYRPAQNENF